MSDGLRWSLLEKYGLIGIKAPKAPPSRYTGTGKEAATWRGMEQETAEWKALFMAAQRKIVELTNELVRVAGRVEPRNTVAARAASLSWKQRHYANGGCTQCRNKREPDSRIKMCAMCAHKNKALCKRRQKRLALRRVSATGLKS